MSYFSADLVDGILSGVLIFSVIINLRQTKFIGG